MNIDIEAVLAGLKDGKSLRTQLSLDALNKLLREYYESGKKDFSITTIGRLSETSGGLGYESIRATGNKHFRSLIEAWASKALTTTKKPYLTKSKNIGIDHQLLERIEDTALRALFGQIVRDRDRYKREINILKNKTQIIIDKRPVTYSEIPHDAKVELFPSFRGVCTDNEIKALKFVCSDEWLMKFNFQANDLGQVKDEYGTELMPRGFRTGLKKILKEF